MRNVRPIFWFGLAFSVGLYFMTRTRVKATGKTVAEEVIEGVERIVSGPRGIRNNNPGNIERTATRWRGMSTDQSADARFAVFDAPEWGIRAMARVIRTYMGRGSNTVRSIINTWAPPSENDTGAYVAAVARNIGVGPDEPISMAALPGLIAAIIQHENGQQPYPAEVIARGIELERSA